MNLEPSLLGQVPLIWDLETGLLFFTVVVEGRPLPEFVDIL